MTERNAVWKDVLDGASLHVILRPDLAAADYAEDTVEAFELVNVLIDGETCWGKTRPVHPSQTFQGLESTGWDLRMPCSYAYNNFANLVICSSYLSGMMRVYEAAAYKEVTFLSRPWGKVIWDSKTMPDVGPVMEAIDAARALRVAILDDEGFWNVHAVDLAACIPDRIRFRLFTEADGYPNAMRSADAMTTLAQQLEASAETTGYCENQPFFSCQYRLETDGAFLRLYQDGGPVDGRYERLKVFAAL